MLGPGRVSVRSHGWLLQLWRYGVIQSKLLKVSYEKRLAFIRDVAIV
jgi:hypothetical protein